MPDENGTEATRSDAPSADDGLFGDALDDKTAANLETEEAKPDDPQDEKDSDEAEDQASPSKDLKVVVSVKGGRATIGVQQPSSDPHIETFDDLDVSGLSQEVSAVVERARARWEDAPKHPAYARPAPPARRRNRGGQEASTETSEETQAQQQTMRLF